MKYPVAIHRSPDFSASAVNQNNHFSSFLGICILSMIFLFPTALWAQWEDPKEADEIEKNEVEDNVFYVHVGVSLSGATARGFSKINVLGGAGLLMPIEDVWKFGLEGNIVQKGERVVGRNNFQFEEYIANLIYAQVAGYLSYDFSERISAFLGPGIGVLIYQDERGRFDNVQTETEYRTIEVSAVGGVRFVLTDRISLAGRFDQSVLPVKKGADGVNIAQITGARQYHTVAAFCVEYKF